MVSEKLLSRKIKSPKSTDNRVGLTKNLFWVFIVLYILFSLLLFDPKLFTGGDNAVYINLAQSLVHGKGYKDLNKPGEPGHTQYPPGLPLLLSLVMLVFGKSVIAMKFFIMLCGVAAFYLFYLISRRVFKDNFFLACAAYLLVPIFISYNHWILSEIPFLLANLAVIYFILRTEEGKKIFYYPAFLCTVFAFFIRTPGIALVMAVLAYLIVRRKYRELLIFSALFLVLLIPWLIRNAHYSQTGGYIDQFLAKNMYQPDLGRIGIADFLGRIFNNFRAYIFAILPQSLFSAITAKPLLFLLGLLSTTLLGYELYNRRREWSIFEFFLIFGFPLQLIWPAVWTSDRFLLPLLPVMIIYLLLGLIRLSARIKYLIPALSIFFILVNTLAIFAQARAAVTNNRAYLRGDHYAGYEPVWRRYFETIDWIKKNIPDDKIILNRKPEFVYLLSGHKSFIYPFTTNSDKMQASINQADYILLDYCWNTTPMYLIPALNKEPDKYEVAYRTRPPEFYVLKIKK